MVSGPSPDAKEAVKLDLSQIRAGLWLNFWGPRRVSELRPQGQAMMAMMKKFGRNITCFCFLSYQIQNIK
jgi:hypothetical protein